MEKKVSPTFDGLGELFLQPAPLIGGVRKICVEDLRVDDEDAMRSDVHTLPRWPDLCVELRESLGRHVVRGHCGIGFVADVVITGDVVGREAEVVNLFEGFAQRLVETGCLGVFLDKVA